MTDTLTTAERSRVMSRIRSVDTRPEKLLRAFLSDHGFRLKTHDRSLPGKPDIVIPRCRAVIFVNGCFWHKHAGCKRAGFPRTRIQFWRRKILGNVSRDRRNTSSLRKMGWRVITVWQCQLAPKKVEKRLTSLLAGLLSTSSDRSNPPRRSTIRERKRATTVATLRSCTC